MKVPEVMSQVTNLNQLFASRSMNMNSKRFIDFQGIRYSYEDAYEKTLMFAAGLKNLGIQKDDRVAVLFSNCPEYVFVYFGTLALGANIVPINTFFVPDEVNHILKDSGAKVFVTSSEFEKIAHQVEDKVDSIKKIVMLNKIEHTHPWVKFEYMYEHGKLSLEEVADPEPDSLAAILYTSGTTGKPKGAMLTHRNLLSNGEMCYKTKLVTEKDKVLMFLPLFHSFSFTVGIVTVMTAGAAVYLMKSVHPFSEVVKTVLLKRITIFIGIPQVYRILSMQNIPGWFKLINPLRICISGAAPLPVKVWETFEKKFKTPLLEGYGLTEASPVVSVNPLDARKGGSTGLPMPGIDLKILNDIGEVLPIGEVGEIVIKGPNVMLGYYNQPEATKETFTPDGYLMTGDYGKVDTDGYIMIVDRKKDLILYKGMNVYPREVEEVIYQHPKVAEVAVIGIPDTHHGEVPVVVIVLKEGSTANGTEIRHFCVGKMANFKIPHYMYFWNELPKTSTGKISKVEIRGRLKELMGKGEPAK
ncbi:MAG: long-chain-fatty-acid--CoA ligase [Elusimicrobiota bacterium]